MATLVVSATDQSNDYSNCTNYQGGSVVVGNEWIAADETCDIEYINTFLRTDNEVGNCWLEVWNAARTALVTNGTSDTVAVSAVSDSGAVQQFTWSGSKPAITASTKYHIMLCSNSVDGGGIWWEGGNNVAAGFYKWEMDYSDKSWANQITDDSHYIEIYKSDAGGTQVLAGTIGAAATVTGDLTLLNAQPVYEGHGGIGESQDSDTVNVPYPTTINENDILILQTLSTVDDDFDTPSGWNFANSVNQGANSTAAWYWKRAVGTESGNVACTRLETTGGFFGIISRWSNCKTSGTPFEGATSANGSSSTVSSSSITPTVNYNRIVCLICAEAATAVGTLAGGNYAEDFEVNSA